MRSLQPLGTVVPAGRANPTLGGLSTQVALDLAAPDSIRAAVREVRPTLIVNAAAYTAVDKAEEEHELAQVINGEAPGVLAEEAREIGAGLVHYSTDYVFDGKDSAPHSENDAPNPINVYGATKLAGERAIEAVGVPHVILRTSWVYSTRGTNFLRTMLRLMGEREELSIVNDQIGAPTWSRCIAEATAQILAVMRSGDCTAFSRIGEHSGTYHLTCGGRTSWHGFAAEIQKFSEAGAAQCRLKGIPATEYPTPARRPENSVLSNDKLAAAFQMKLPSWQTALELCMAPGDNPT